MNRYLDLLRREGDFRRVYVSQLVSLGGDWFAIIPLLILLERESGSGLWGGFVLATDTLLVALLSPYAGTIVDRVDRRRLMIAADVASAVVVLLLLLVRSEATAWIALVAIGALAAAKAFHYPASNAALPNLVDPVDLPTANVLAGASWGTMLAVGAALGGVMTEVAGSDVCFVLDAASFALSAVLVARTTKAFQEPGEPRSRGTVRGDVGETVGYIRSHPKVLALVTVKSAVGLGNGTLVLFPLFAQRVFDVGGAGTGLFFAGRGLGALIGPMLVRGRAASERAQWPLLVSGMVGFGVGYILFGFAPAFPVALALVVVAHIGGGANWVVTTYALQSSVPDRLRGRVFSLDFMVATLAIALSQVVAGLLSDTVDVRVLASSFGAVTLIYAVVWATATGAAWKGSVTEQSKES